MRDLFCTSGVEYSRVRKEIRLAQMAQHEAEVEAEDYRQALFLARRHAIEASQQAPGCRSIWWALSLIDAALAKEPFRNPGRPFKRVPRRRMEAQ